MINIQECTGKGECCEYHANHNLPGNNLDAVYLAPECIIRGKFHFKFAALRTCQDVICQCRQLVQPLNEVSDQFRADLQGSSSAGPRLAERTSCSVTALV